MHFGFMNVNLFSSDLPYVVAIHMAIFLVASTI
jgi:hypothetical protein